MVNMPLTDEEYVARDQAQKTLRWSLRLLSDAAASMPSADELHHAIGVLDGVDPLYNAGKAYRLVEVLRNNKVQQLFDRLAQVGPHRSRGEKGQIEELAKMIEAEPYKMSAGSYRDPYPILAKLYGIFFDTNVWNTKDAHFGFFDDIDFLGIGNVGTAVRWTLRERAEDLSHIDPQVIQTLCSLDDVYSRITSARSIGFPVWSRLRETNSLAASPAQAHEGDHHVRETPRHNLRVRLPETLTWKHMYGPMSLFQEQPIDVKDPPDLEHPPDWRRPSGNTYSSKGYIVDAKSGLLVRIKLTLCVSDADPHIQALRISVGDGSSGWLPTSSLHQHGYSDMPGFNALYITPGKISTPTFGFAGPGEKTNSNMGMKVTGLRDVSSTPWAIKNLHKFQPTPVAAVNASRVPLGRWY